MQKNIIIGFNDTTCFRKKILESNNGLDDFGKLLHNAITKKKLRKIYEYVLKQGALGGKLLGALKHELQKNFFEKKLMFHLNSLKGTEIIHKN